MDRTDLLALTEDALAALANRGLVKRAAKEPAPEVATVDGTVRGRFPDGTESALPHGATLDAAWCSCAATGICRHEIALVLAYQRLHEKPAFAAWSPGEISDETLTKTFGERVMTSARRLAKAGYSVRLRWPAAEDPVATAELSTCTVRFLVPGDIGHVDTDVVAAKRDEVVVLAVWAFREADARGLTENALFDVGRVAAAPGEALSAAVDLATQVLTDGAANASPILIAALRTAGDRLSEEKLHWPAAAVADLADQLTAYQDRSSRYRPERVAELITELHARQRATGPRSQVLGGDEPADTPLRRVRLTSLGCRVRGDGSAEVFLASDSAVLVVRRPAASRRLLGTSLDTVAVSTIVSESAVRTASRVVRIGSNRVGKTSVTPVGSGWDQLPDALVVRDFKATVEQLADLPPRFVRPRIEAEFVRVTEIAEVEDIGYRPGAQRLDATIVDTKGTEALISATYRGICPGALDALAEALAADPHSISGSLRRQNGTLVIDPIAIRTPTTLIVPDLTPTHQPTHLPDTMITYPSTLDRALTACAELAHRGLNHTPTRTHLDETATDLHHAGFHTTATRLSTLARTPTTETWLSTELRLLTLIELT